MKGGVALENMGDRLKRLRLEHGMTQEEVGKILGVQKAAINKYEKGNVENIKRSSVLKLANLYGVKPSYILCMEDNDAPSQNDISTLYNQLDTEDKAEIRGAIKQMLKADKYKTNTIADDMIETIEKANQVFGNSTNIKSL